MKEGTLHLPALRYYHRYFWFVVGSNRNIFNLPHNEETVYNASKYDMLVVKKLAARARDVKLTAISVLATVRLEENATDTSQ